jgi:hypothetical protein
MRLFATLMLVSACSDYGVAAKAQPEGGADVEPDSGGQSDNDSGENPEETGIPSDTGSSFPGAATSKIYVHSASTLYSWDPSSGLTRVGNFHDSRGSFTEMTDLAIDLGGRMIGVGWNTLYSVDATTAELVALSTSDQQLVGLTFLADGTLVGAGEALYEIDLSTGRTTALHSGTFTTSGDVVGAPDGLLYWTVVGDWEDELVVYDPTTRLATNRGGVGTSGLWGVAWADDILYGFSSSGEVVAIDTGSASASRLADAGENLWGATTNPVRW